MNCKIIWIFDLVVAIGRAMESCKALGVNVDNRFREVTKMALAKIEEALGEEVIKVE